MQLPRRKKFWLGLALISLVGLAFRLLVCRDLFAVQQTRFPPEGTDMATYYRLAREILHGRWPEAFYFQPFYYSVFLPFALLVSAGRTWGPAVVQAGLGAATVWLTGLCAARLFGYRAAWCAALLLALARFHMFYTPFLLIAVLQTFWIILVVYLAIRAYDRNRRRDWLLLALIVGAAVLTRGNVLLFLPLILGLLVWRNRQEKGRALALGMAFVVVMYLPQLPFAVKNFRHYHRWTGPSSAADAVLALGNTPEAPPGGLSYTRSYHEWMTEARKPPDQRIPVARKILHWARREPLAYAELKLRILLLYWDRREIPNNVNYPAFRPWSPMLRLPFLFGFGVIAPLAICGMTATRYRGKPLRIFVLGMLVAYCLATVLFYILARFRLPTVPLLCVFAGAGIRNGWQGMVRTLREKAGWRKASPAYCGLILGIVAVWAMYPLYELRWGPGLLRIARPDGTRVEHPDSLTIADHGSALPFGWYRLQLSPQPLQVIKTMRLPADRAAGLAVEKMMVEAAFFSEVDSRIEVSFPTSGGAWKATVMELPANLGPQWLPLPWHVSPEGDLIIAEFAVRLIKGHASLAVDRTRCYRRTRVGSDGEDPQPLRGEAVLRIEIPRQIPAGNI